jgi:hypothetical protein
LAFSLCCCIEGENNWLISFRKGRKGGWEPFCGLYNIFFFFFLSAQICGVILFYLVHFMDKWFCLILIFCKMICVQ